MKFMTKRVHQGGIFVFVGMIVALASLGAVGSTVQAGSSNNEILTTIIHGVEYNESLIKDMEAQGEETFHYISSYREPFLKAGVPVEEMRDLIMEVSWGFKGKKEYSYIKMKTVDGEPIIETQEAYDGERGYVYQLPTSKQKGKGGISTGPLLWSVESVHRLMGYAYGKSLSALLKEGETRLLDEMEIIGGRKCYVVETTAVVSSGPGKAPEPRRIKYWIDPEAGFCPLKFERYGGKHFAEYFGTPPLVEVVDNITLKRFDEGVWLPVEGTLNFYVSNFDSKTGKKVVSQNSTEHRLTWHTIKINKGIPDNKFLIKFPTGIEVWDNNIQSSYLIF